MTTTPNMGIDKPTLGGDAGTWDDKLNAGLDKIDAHNHIAGAGALIPTAGLNINADLTFSGSWAPTNLHRIQFASVTALAANNKSLFVSSSDNELYWRSNAGNNVKLTSGSALNVAAFTGGIGGDYTAVSALVVFDDATDSYWFQQQVGNSVRQYARMRSGDVDLYEYKAAPTAGVPTTRVRLASPAALAASYTVTFPGALPASSGYVQMDSSGVLSVTPDRVLKMCGCAGTSTTNANITFSATTGEIITGAAVDLVFSVPLLTGDRIKSVTVARFGDGAVDLIGAGIDVRTVAADSTAVSLGASGAISNLAAAWTDTVIDVADTVITSGVCVLIIISVNAANARFNDIRVTYDHP